MRLPPVRGFEGQDPGGCGAARVKASHVLLGAGVVAVNPGGALSLGLVSERVPVAVGVECVPCSVFSLDGPDAHPLNGASGALTKRVVVAGVVNAQATCLSSVSLASRELTQRP